jgi:hypothetical protein
MDKQAPKRKAESADTAVARHSAIVDADQKGESAMLWTSHSLHLLLCQGGSQEFLPQKSCLLPALVLRLGNSEKHGVHSEHEFVLVVL